MGQKLQNVTKKKCSMDTVASSPTTHSRPSGEPLCWTMPLTDKFPPPSSSGVSLYSPRFTLIVWGSGGVVASALAFHQGDPSSMLGVRSRIFACGNRAGRCRLPAGFLGNSRLTGIYGSRLESPSLGGCYLALGHECIYPHWLSKPGFEEPPTPLQSIWHRLMGTISPGTRGEGWTGAYTWEAQWTLELERTSRAMQPLCWTMPLTDKFPPPSSSGVSLYSPRFTLIVWGSGGVVASALAFHQGDPSSMLGVRSRIFACGNRAGRCRLPAGFLGNSRLTGIYGSRLESPSLGGCYLALGHECIYPHWLSKPGFEEPPTPLQSIWHRLMGTISPGTRGEGWTGAYTWEAQWTLELERTSRAMLTVKQGDQVLGDIGRGVHQCRIKRRWNLRAGTPSGEFGWSQDLRGGEGGGGSFKTKQIISVLTVTSCSSHRLGSGSVVGAHLDSLLSPGRPARCLVAPSPGSLGMIDSGDLTGVTAPPPPFWRNR
ncbi:hypothetical protein PR048_002550 [Dryococelus australis]|uniref:Uncharacterized protein n=1 Tax=Dryococelus australis TaxID=614101 RepID=A0ABQ9ILY0_9NEOP|nr:hypothetical protein PR048_002550 [Dryococelus australis]